MNKHEKHLYQENSLSQQLLMLFLLGNTVFTIFFANNVDVDYELGLFIMLNIIMSLISFLTAVRQKVYSIFWGYFGIAIAAFQFLRLIWIPEEIISPLRLQLLGVLIGTGVLALIASLISVKRSSERKNYIEEHNIDLVILQK
jgi:hypothetical protein